MESGQVVVNVDKPQRMKKGKNPAASEERKALLNYERLKRESAMGTRNNEHLRHAWMKIMTKVEIPSMKEDIEVSRNIFDRTLDIKDHRVHSMVKWLDEAEVQYNRNVGGHMEIIQRLEEIYGDRSSEGYDRFKEDLDGIIDENQTDVDKILSINDDSEDLLQSIIMREEKYCGELLENIESEIAYKLENLRDERSHSIKIALIDIENKIKFHWNLMNSIITDYSNATRHRRTSHDNLKVKDTRDRKIIADQLVETVELTELIHKYEERIKKLENSTSDITYNINMEKSLSWEAYSSMKERFHNEKMIDKTQMTHMTREYNLAVKYLERLVKKAQTVIACIRMCRKFETQMDEQLPVQLDLEKNGLGCFKYFWYRVGIVDVDKMNLREEKKGLQVENAYLKKLIKAKICGKNKN